MVLRPAHFWIAATLLSGTLAAGQANSSAPANLAAATAAAAGEVWPIKDGTVVLSDFKFGTGETLPQLRLHYLILG